MTHHNAIHSLLIWLPCLSIRFQCCGMNSWARVTLCGGVMCGLEFHIILYIFFLSQPFLCVIVSVYVLDLYLPLSVTNDLFGFHFLGLWTVVRVHTHTSRTDFLVSEITLCFLFTMPAPAAVQDACSFVQDACFSPRNLRYCRSNSIATHTVLIVAMWVWRLVPVRPFKKSDRRGTKLAKTL